MKQLRPEQKTIVKRGALLSAIVVLLIIAAWINGSTPGDLPAGGNAQLSSAAASPTPRATAASLQQRTGDYFADFRSDRAQVRAQEIELLDGIINADKDKEAVKEANARKIRISAAIEQEFALEKTLLAKGYEDVAAIVREDLATVAVKKPELNQSDAARILEAAKQETGLEADNIKIIPVP